MRRWLSIGLWAEVSEMLGHASASMTLNVYAHVVGSMKQDAVDSMDRILTT